MTQRPHDTGREAGRQSAAVQQTGFQQRAPNCTAKASEQGMARQHRLRDWIDSQASVTRIWLDQLIAEGDPQDMVTLIHKQAAWLDLMRSRLVES
jgi:hypothetical protein